MIIDKDKIMQPKTVVHCDTEEKANILLKWAHDQGYEWCSGTSYLADNEYKIHNQYTCYNLFRNKVCNKQYYENEGYYILKFNDIYKVEPIQEVQHTGKKRFNIRRP